MKEINGNLITLANKSEFDVIVQGNNCYCTQRSGLAPQMVKAFETDKFKMESLEYKGDINKLGTIDFELKVNDSGDDLFVVNAYSQFDFGRVSASNPIPPVSYEALSLIFKKMNHTFKGKRIGLPLIGCGLAGGDWSIVKSMIIKEFTDCDVTIVHYNG